MAEERIALPHKLTLNDRNTLTMSGVSEVVSFDDTAVILRTGMGTLLVQGSQLHLRTLCPEGGQVEVDGKVTALIYEEPRPAGSWLQKLFR